MKARGVRFIRYRYSHHSPHSGYSRMAEYGERALGAETITVGRPVSPRLVRQRMFWWLAKGTPGYTREAMAAELTVARRALTERDCIFHFLYGETNYHYAGHLDGLRDNRIVASFHQPPAVIESVVQMRWHLQRLAAVVCVGSNQADYFSAFIEPKKIHSVPLGIDVEYYRPSMDQERDPDLCVVVGENYRDFPTLRGVIELVAYMRPRTRFVCVMPPTGVPLIGMHSNLEVRSGISEAELLSLYRTAALMVMPLHDATANNAILEGMACGVPLVVSDVGAVRDYVSPTGAELLPPHDARRMADAVVDLLADEQRRADMGSHARQQALKFAWPNVIDQLKRVYESVN